jgi:O-succinylbenzoic acid--CoA ligase
MADWLAQRTALVGARLAVLADDGALTYAQLDARADDLAGRLAAAGVRAGDRVGVMLPASAEHVALLHALMRLGAVTVPVDPRFPEPEAQRRVAHVRAKLVVAERSGPGQVTFEELRGQARAPFERAEPEGVQALVFTSGTSGQPRAASLTYANHAASAAQVGFHLGMHPADRWLACVPLHHVGGLGVVMRSVLWGSALQVQARFDAARASEALDTGATLASMVPVMLQRVLDARGARPFPHTLRAILLGGDAASPELLRAARALGAPVLPTYGLTEAASMVACAPLEGPCPDASAGRPLMLTQARVVGEAGDTLGPGEVGELALRGLTLMQGYWDEDSRGQDWLRTGDLGFLDKDGFLHVVGRLGDRITTGGEKVDPLEVEAALRDHPTVAEACVVGLPDRVWGQQVMAAVVLRPGMALDEDALRAHGKQRLASYKVPKRFTRMAALPRNEAGKLLRWKVAEELALP